MKWLRETGLATRPSPPPPAPAHVAALHTPAAGGEVSFPRHIVSLAGKGVAGRAELAGQAELAEGEGAGNLLVAACCCERAIITRPRALPTTATSISSRPPALEGCGTSRGALGLNSRGSIIGVVI